MAVLVIFLLLTAYFQSPRLAGIAVSAVPAVLAGVVFGTLGDGHYAQHSVVHGSDHGGRRGRRQCDFVAHVCRTGAAAGIRSANGRHLGRHEPVAADPDDQLAPCSPAWCRWPWASGEGGEQTAPLGRAVIGGLAAATVATLLILPAVFAVVQRRASRQSVSLDPLRSSGEYRSRMSRVRGPRKSNRPIRLIGTSACKECCRSWRPA